MVLCYNLTRVLNILGFDAVVACFAKRAAERAILCLPRMIRTATGRATALLRHVSAKSTQNSPISCPRFRTAP